MPKQVKQKEQKEQIQDKKVIFNEDTKIIKEESCDYNCLKNRIQSLGKHLLTKNKKKTKNNQNENNNILTSSETQIDLSNIFSNEKLIYYLIIVGKHSLLKIKVFSLNKKIRHICNIEFLQFLNTAFNWLVKRFFNLKPLEMISSLKGMSYITLRESNKFINSCKQFENNTFKNQFLMFKESKGDPKIKSNNEKLSRLNKNDKNKKEVFKYLKELIINIDHYNSTIEILKSKYNEINSFISKGKNDRNNDEEIFLERLNHYSNLIYSKNENSDITTIKKNAEDNDFINIKKKKPDLVDNNNNDNSNNDQNFELSNQDNQLDAYFDNNCDITNNLDILDNTILTKNELIKLLNTNNETNINDYLKEKSLFPLNNKSKNINKTLLKDEIKLKITTEEEYFEKNKQIKNEEIVKNFLIIKESIKDKNILNQNRDSCYKNECNSNTSDINKALYKCNLIFNDNKKHYLNQNSISINEMIQKLFYNSRNGINEKNDNRKNTTTIYYSKEISKYDKYDRNFRNNEDTPINNININYDMHIIEDFDNDVIVNEEDYKANSLEINNSKSSKNSYNKEYNETQLTTISQKERKEKLFNYFDKMLFKNSNSYNGKAEYDLSSILTNIAKDEIKEEKQKDTEFLLKEKTAFCFYSFLEFANNVSKTSVITQNKKFGLIEIS